jgi:hypothetical protein
VVHRTRFPEFVEQLPYVVACVELVEQSGLRMFSNLVGADLGEVSIDSEVEVIFMEHDGFTLPQFRLAAKGEG